MRRCDIAIEATVPAKQYDIYIEASIEADNDEDAVAIVKRLTERVFEHPCVMDVEGALEKVGF